MRTAGRGQGPAGPEVSPAHRAIAWAAEDGPSSAAIVLPDLSALGDPAFLAVQCLNGLTQAMFLFLIASGLTLIFGVLGVLNFAHGSLYMLGAYLSYTITSLFVGSPAAFWVALVLASIGVALVGGLVEAAFLRPVYRREELDQLLVTYALVLIISDARQVRLGRRQPLGAPVPRSSRGRWTSRGGTSPPTTSSSSPLGAAGGPRPLAPALADAVRPPDPRRRQ